MHEDNLASACSKGNSVAQKELYDRYSDALYNTCYRYATDASEADDFFQESFMLILRKIKKFRYHGEGSLKAWLIRLTINNCISQLRKKKQKVELNTEEFEDAFSEEESETFFPENKHDFVNRANFSQEELLMELQKLPENFRMVFNLHVIEGMKHKEIAALLQINEKTSKTRLFRAKIMLQKQLYDKVLETKTI